MNTETTMSNIQFPDFGALLESIKENNRKMDEKAEQYYKEQKERDAKWEAERREQDAKWEAERKEREAKWETERREQDAKWKEREAKWEAERKEANEQMNKTLAEIKRLREDNSSKWGRMIEALCTPAALKLFKERNIGIERISQECRTANLWGEDKMEVDVMYENGHVLVATEVKMTCSAEDVRYFLSQMERFKEYFPGLADRTVYGAIAAIKFNDGADTFARRKGLFVIPFTGEDTFTLLDPTIPPKAF